MRRRSFGSTGRWVSIIGQGTAGLERADRAQAIAALRRGLDLGATHIDTAERYGDGEVERIVAEAIRGRRDEVFLVSKVSGDHASGEGTLRACEASLRRLETDFLDCYLLHWPGDHPLDETLDAFARLKREGKIRAFGVSNFGGSELESALGIAGDGAIAADQVVYHLGRRDHEQDVLPLCREHGIAMVAYSPLGSGRFPVPDSPGGRVLSDVAEAHGASPRQVALAFLLRHRDVFVIPKAARIEHVEDNARAASIELGDGEVETIASVFPVGEPRVRRAG